jgi:hypothetical protein
VNLSFPDVDRAGYPTPHVQCSGPDGCGALLLGANRHLHIADHEKRERELRRVWAAINDLGGAR